VSALAVTLGKVAPLQSLALQKYRANDPFRTYYFLTKGAFYQLDLNHYTRNTLCLGRFRKGIARTTSLEGF
jgi:hypothetical protein